MAASKDGSKLYALLQGALWDEQAKAYETVDGKQYLRVLEFDVASEKWTGRHWKYVLEANHHAIGVYKVELNEGSVGGAVRKIAYIDLMAIADPAKLARKPLTGGVLAFPFFTIENIDVVDQRHIVVGNDNNLPFSRDPGKADDNELVVLEVGDFLKPASAP